MPHSNSYPPREEPRRHDFALSQADIEEFKAIVRSECGVEMTDHEAWNRVIELLNLYRALLGPIPEDPGARQVPRDPLLQRIRGDASLPRMNRDYTISEAEHEREEWKAAPAGDLLERGMQTVCAFLNSYGGRVIFGVDANGKTVPIPGDLDQAQLAITDHIQNHIQPNARAHVDVVAHEGRIYVFVRPDQSQIYSHRNVVFRRVGSSTVALTFQQAKELEDQRRNHVRETAPGVFTRVAQGEHLRCPQCGYSQISGMSVGVTLGAPPGPELCPNCGSELHRA